MGKLKLTNHNQEIKISFPKELAFIFKASKARWFKNLIIFNPNTKVLSVIVSDLDWYEFRNLSFGDVNRFSTSGARDRRKGHLIATGFVVTYVRYTESNYNYDNILNNLSFFIKKDKGYTMCDAIELDYDLYQDDNNRFLIKASIDLSGVAINYDSNRIIESKTKLYHDMRNIVNNLDSYHFNEAIKKVDEIFYYKGIDSNVISYITKEKYAYAMHNLVSISAASLSRTMSIGKFFKDHFPHIPEANINAFIEYNKMLTAYDPNLFSIVSGEDIKKYYNQKYYFKMTGELGNSCMRQEEKQHYMDLYANNSNFKLLIMKAGEADAIMGRALIVTTIDGEVIMDRIYTADTKIINLFHRYAKENNIINIYEHRKPYGKERIISSMSPGNWTKVYDKNYTVSLEWLPKEISALLHKKDKYIAAIHQHANISSSYNVPYIDNFQYLNPFTIQASVNPLNFFTNCDLTDELIDTATVLYHKNKVYDQRYVELNHAGNPVQKPDVVTLDDTATPQGPVTYITHSDDDLDEDIDWDDDNDWDDEEVEVDEEIVDNPYTITAAEEPTTNLVDYLYTRYSVSTGQLPSDYSTTAQSVIQLIEDLNTTSTRPEQNLF